MGSSSSFGRLLDLFGKHRPYTSFHLGQEVEAVHSSSAGVAKGEYGPGLKRFLAPTGSTMLAMIPPMKVLFAPDMSTLWGV